MQTNDSETSAAPEVNATPTPTTKAPKAKKAKTAVKKSAAKAEKKGKAKKAKTGDTPKGPAALKKYAPDYVHDNEHKTAGGNTSVNNGDDVAKKLVGKSIDEVYGMAAKVLVKADPDVTEASLRKQYKHLNVGMQRMNLGNRMRGVLNAK